MPKSLPLMCEVREAVQCGVYDARLREGVLGAETASGAGTSAVQRLSWRCRW